MFQDLDATLARVLTDPAAPTAAAEVSFLTPDKTFAPASPTVNLFLYDVKENRDLRDNTPILERVGTTYVRKAPPIRIDCSYIVTTWSNRSGPARVDEEHRLLGAALVWLSRFPTVPAIYAQGSLVGQRYIPPILVAQLDPNKNAGEFWDALAIPPRPAFYLTVTVAMELGLVEGGALVTTRTTRTTAASGDAEGRVQIGGRVLSSAGVPLGGAVVDVVDAGLRTTSNQDGSYTFPIVPPGARTLRAVALGFQPLSRTVTVPSVPEDYDLTLAPL